MFEQLLKLMKELYNEPAAPDSWTEIVYEKAIESGCSESDAEQLSDAAASIANVFAEEMFAKLEAQDNK